MQSTRRDPGQGRDASAAGLLRNAANRTTVDGVTTLFAPVGGRSRATLSFRVGTVDEPLHQRGISHLIGHLASASADQDPGRCHVTVSASTLSFHFAGNALAVANEIGAVCHWISATADGRAVGERPLREAAELARADQQIHAPEHASVLLHRYGPRWASGAYPEYALQSLSSAHLEEWVARYLNSRNAVLALSGTKATTLRVPLPEGEYQPLPPPPPSSLAGRALLDGERPRISLSGVISTDADHLDRERAAAGLTTEIARARVAHALRKRYGNELKVRASPMTLGPAAVHSVVFVDGRPDDGAKVADIATEAWSVLTDGTLAEGELAAHVRKRLAAYDRAAADADGQHSLLHRQALGALNDTPWSPALERTMLTSLKPELVAKQIADLGTSTVLQMSPVDPPVRPWEGRRPASGFAPDGAVFRSRPAYGAGTSGQPPARLLVGDAGVTHVEPGGVVRQQRWQDIALARVWDDGRTLLTDDAARVFEIRPERWMAPELVGEAISRHIPSSASVVPMGARDTPPPAPLRLSDRVAPAWWWAASVLGALLAASAALLPVPGSLPWLRWALLAVGVVALVVGGSFVLETTMTERRLRASRPEPARAG